jgi:futalosine hydrolase
VRTFGNKLDVLITGAGMVPTAFALGRQFSNHKYDLAINLGIAGSFDRSIALAMCLKLPKIPLPNSVPKDDEIYPITTLALAKIPLNPTPRWMTVCNSFYLAKKQKPLRLTQCMATRHLYKKYSER